MKRLVVLAVLMLALALPAMSQAICVSGLPGDWDDCSIRRGTREPASWCGGNSFRGGGVGEFGFRLRQIIEQAKAKAEHLLDESRIAE